MYFLEIDFVNRFPSPMAYANEMNTWISTLKSNFPEAQIAVLSASENPTSPTGNPTLNRIKLWNDELLNNLTATEVAFTFHQYFRHGNPPTDPVSITNILGTIVSTWQETKTYTVDELPNDAKIWWTEYNLNDDLGGNHIVATSWVHGMISSLLHLLMLEEPKIEMIINHQICGGVAFASLDSYLATGDTTTNRLTAEGNAMRLLHNAEKGKSQAFKLDFSNNPNISVGGTVNYPSLIGWQFQNDTQKDLILINLSEDAFSLDLSALSSETFAYEQITASDVSEIDITTKDLIIQKDFESNTLNLSAYSLTRIELNPTITSLRESPALDFNIYPNPTQDFLQITFGRSLKGKLSIINTQGKTVFSKELLQNTSNLRIDIGENWTSALYFVKIITDKGESIVKRVMIE